MFIPLFLCPVHDNKECLESIVFESQSHGLPGIEELMAQQCNPRNTKPSN